MLKERLQQDLKSVFKEGKELETSVLRMAISAIYNKETEKRTRIWREKPELGTEELETESQLTDEEMVEVISSELKKRKEASLEYDKGRRKDLSEKEKKEAEILQKYLPEQLSEEEIQNLVKEAIEKIGATEIKDVGKVMVELMPKVKGKADGGAVSKIVKELLNPQL